MTMLAGKANEFGLGDNEGLFQGTIPSIVHVPWLRINPTAGGEKNVMFFFKVISSIAL